MKRKTNLFYKSASQDSSFLTFSNYTESLTANLMSTDNKIYPSTFLCISMPKLNSRDFAIESYNKWKTTILDTKNVSYTLKTNVFENYVIQDSTNINKIYVDSLGTEYKAGISIKESQMEFLMNTTLSKTTLITYRNDTKHTKISEKSNNVNSPYSITIEKVLLDYKDDPAFMTKEDELSTFIWNKQQLINKLVTYYENKLASLRDFCVDKDMNQESVLLPLNYLLETLQSFDSSIKINYVGDITEQDWNGTFSDTICVVDTRSFKSGTIVSDNNYAMSLAPVDGDDTKENPLNNYDSERYLHGWYTTKSEYIEELDFDKDEKNTVSINPVSTNNLYTNLYSKLSTEEQIKFKRTHNISTSDTDDYNSYIMMVPEADKQIPEYVKTLEDIIKASEIKEEYIGPHYVENLKPEYDNYENGTHYYELTSPLKEISFTNHNDVKEWNEVSFNLLIPLFDLVDTNYNTNSTNVESSDHLNLTNEDEDKEMCVKNMPLGIWFSGPQFVTLKSDLSTGFSPSWSLSLSSQFKPFPTSDYMPSEITNDAKKEAYCTFAQILSRQNEVLDKFVDMSKIMNKLSERVTSLESAVGSVLTAYNLDTFRTDIMDFKNQITYQVSYLEASIEGLQLQWIQREG